MLKVRNFDNLGMIVYNSKIFNPLKKNMKTKFLPLVFSLIGLSTLSATAGLQFGIGPSLYSGTEYDDEKRGGFNAELGLLLDQQPIDLFIGAKITYVDGLGSGLEELDAFEGALAGRVLFPVATNWLKLYVEGSLGTANLGVAGETKFKTTVKGKDFSVGTKFDENDWVFAYGVGVGVQFDFTSWLGIRVGYEFHNFGEVEAFGLKTDPGSLNGIVGSLVLKF